MTFLASSTFCKTSLSFYESFPMSHIFYYILLFFGACFFVHIILFTCVFIFYIIFTAIFFKKTFYFSCY